MLACRPDITSTASHQTYQLEVKRAGIWCAMTLMCGELVSPTFCRRGELLHALGRDDLGSSAASWVVLDFG